MKVKLNLDRAAMKAFAVHHAEKIVFVVVVLCFLVFVYGAIARERLSFTPDDLSSRAKKALENVQKTPKEVGLREVADFPRLAVINYKPVESKWYQSVTRFDAPLKEKRRTRSTPAVLPLEKPQAAAGNGAFAMQDFAMAGNLQMRPANPNKGQRYVVVVGLIPFAKQKQEYESAFKGAEGLSADPGGAMAGPMMMPGNPMMSGSYGASGTAGGPTGRVELPAYAYYRVQRAEVVTGDEDPATLVWEKQDIRKSFWKARLWRSAGGEVVSPFYLHVGRYPMAFPLGPLVGNTWGPECAHEPEIKFLERAMAMGNYMTSGAPGMNPSEMMVPAAGMPYPGAKPPKGSKSDKGVAKKTKTGPEEPATAPKPRPMPELTGPDEPMDDMSGMMPMGTGPYPGMGPPGGSMSMDASTSMPYGGMTPGMPPGMSPGMPPGMDYSTDSSMGPMGEGMGMPGAARFATIQYQLFRFFDFDVEPGKRYRYRVRLVLANPNYNVNPIFLEDEKQAKIPRLEETGENDEKGWSDPTEPVFVSRDARVLVGSVSMPREQQLAVMEPTATFGVVRFDMDTGETLFQEFPDPQSGSKQIPGKIFRGQLASFRGVPKPTSAATPYGASPYSTTPYGSSDSSMPGMVPTMPGMAPTPGGRPGTDGTEEPETIDFVSDFLLLDMNGGRTIPGKARLQEPSRMLWLDPAGQLVVRDDIRDLEEYEQFKPEEGTTGPGGRTMTGMPPGYPTGMGPPTGPTPPGMDSSSSSPEMYSELMKGHMSSTKGGRKPAPKPKRQRGSSSDS